MNLVDKVAAVASLGLVPGWRWWRQRKAASAKAPQPAEVVLFPKQQPSPAQAFAPGEPAPSTRGGAYGEARPKPDGALVLKPAIVPFDGSFESFRVDPLY